MAEEEQGVEACLDSSIYYLCKFVDYLKKSL